MKDALLAAIPEAYRSLLGCSWGRIVTTPDDIDPCDERATLIVVLHDGPADTVGTEVRLCQRHVDRMAQETEPRTAPTS